jgi:16S rRNA (guanine527-N7)-methyltransferase
VSEKLERTTIRGELEKSALELHCPAIDGVLLDRLALYLDELARWNASTNLTGPLDAGALASHAVESLLGSSLLPPGAGVLDIGSGGGFPGVPLALAGADVTLLEPRERRAAFLRHVLRSVPGLNARVLVDRVERLSGHSYDAATVRGVGNLGRLLEGGKFLKPEGSLLVWTGDAGALEEELRGFSVVSELAIPGSRRRRIALFRKCSTGNR